MKKMFFALVLAALFLAAIAPQSEAMADKKFYTVTARGRLLLFVVETPCRERVRITRSMDYDKMRIDVTVVRGEPLVAGRLCVPTRTLVVKHPLFVARNHGEWRVYINGHFFARMRL